MSWRVVVSRRAAKALHDISSDDSDRIMAAISGMQEDPYRGDIKVLRGTGGVLRRRVGAWRVLVQVDGKARRVEILDIVRRTSTTY
jgi:mRNA-degrading endonuclease RelE of RelBE toxin-antitoxin system